MDEIIRMFGGAENIWNAIQTNAERFGIESTRVMLELFYVLKSPETSMINKTLIVTALGYQLLPEDVLPREKYGLLGFLDNFVTIGFAYSKVKSSVTPQIANQVNNILYQWFGVESSQQQLGSHSNQHSRFINLCNHNKHQHQILTVSQRNQSGMMTRMW
jgi:uncharacterized membrane protein YkvA (DUF1232 family)